MAFILRVRDKDGNIIDIPAVKGDKGDTGATGSKGADGKTPIKGTDYFTEADKAEFVKAVLDALPKAEEDEF